MNGETLSVTGIGDDAGQTRRRALGSLQSEEEFRNIFVNAPVGIYHSTADRLLIANPALAKMFGFEHPVEMIASVQQPEKLFVHPHERSEFLTEVVKSDTYVQREFEYRRKDGSTFHATLRMQAVRDETGTVQFFRGFVEDITERRQLAEHLRQAQKMEAVGQLAGGVAHDFNNILAATLMHLGLLQHSDEFTTGAKESLKEVEREITRAANLTRQLLVFSRQQVAHIETLDLNTVINNLLTMVRRILGEDIVLAFDGSPTGVCVRADLSMIEQVVMNLCINARDAMPKGGPLVLATALVDIEAVPAHSNADARPGRFVCLSVADKGCGMNEMVLKRLFEPYFTTKEVGKGTGLGLATVFGIVKQHQGWIDVQSAPGLGTTFLVYLPAATHRADSPIPPSGPADVKGGSETILLVEDELSVRRVVALSLRILGYAVLETGNGVEALKAWEEHHQKIDLLFTDKRG